MVNTRSQMAHQEQQLNNENYFEEQRNHQSSRNTSRRETPREINTSYLHTY